MSADILVLSACTGDKAINPPVVGCADIDESSQTSLLEAHPNVSLPAKSLYTGNEHNHVEAAVDQLMKIAEVDWRIISAGFGLVSPKTHLPSYECTFNDDESVRERVKWLGQNPELLTKAEQRQVVAEELGVPADIEHALADGYDLAFVVLGEDYLHATGSALSSLPEPVQKT